MAKSAIDIALANIDADIASLQRSKEIILAAAASVPVTSDAPKTRKPRKPRSKPGLPTQEGL